jgi:hypothetical protein
MLGIVQDSDVSSACIFRRLIRNHSAGIIIFLKID